MPVSAIKKSHGFAPSQTRGGTRIQFWGLWRALPVARSAVPYGTRRRRRVWLGPVLRRLSAPSSVCLTAGYGSGRQFRAGSRSYASDRLLSSRFLLLLLCSHGMYGPTARRVVVTNPDG